jgi:hypothetical protein
METRQKCTCCENTSKFCWIFFHIIEATKKTGRDTSFILAAPLFKHHGQCPGKVGASELQGIKMYDTRCPKIRPNMLLFVFVLWLLKTKRCKNSVFESCNKGKLSKS